MGRGIIFIVAVAVLGGSSIMQSTFISSRSTGDTISEHEYELLARQIAISAMNIGISEVKNDFANAHSISYNDVPLNHGFFDLTSSLLATGNMGLQSVGMIDGAEYYVCSTIDPGNGGSIESSLMVMSPNASVNYVGNAFLVMGEDVLPPSGAGFSRTRGGPVLSGDTPVHAIGVESASMESTFESEASPNQESNITGVDGDLDVYYGEFALDTDLLYSEITANIDTTLSAGRYNSNEVFGSPTDPAIVHIDGDTEITGTWEGYGVLLIEGDVSISAGDFSWEGIVMVNAPEGESIDVNFSGGAEIYGSVILRNENTTTDSRNHLNFSIGGNAALMYSATAIDALPNVLTSIHRYAPSKARVVSRRESKAACM